MKCGQGRYPGGSKYPFLFTVLIPTYNRAGYMERALESIRKQDRSDVEIIVVDDGSTDETGLKVRNWQKKTRLKVRYYWKENQGKPAAINFALHKICGYFTVVLDSDDALAPGALLCLKEWWESIDPKMVHRFAGIEGLAADMSTGKVMGDPYPASPLDINYLECRYRYRVRGDKKQAIRTDVMREFPFPVFPGERDLRESVVFARMAHRYLFRCINQVIQLCEQLPDGLTARPFSRRMGSPKGFSLAFQELLNLHSTYLSPRDTYRAAVRYVRHSWAAGAGPLAQLRGLSLRKWPFWAMAFWEGSGGALKDRLRLIFMKEDIKG